MDNGSEFLHCKKLERSVFSKAQRTQIYYAHAYSSWERGSNENFHGFIRYFIPKTTAIKNIRETEIKESEKFINNYLKKSSMDTARKIPFSCSLVKHHTHCTEEKFHFNLQSARFSIFIS